MMDIGPPDSKRPRIGSGSGSWSNSSPHLRSLPNPHPGPGPGPGPHPPPPPPFERPSPFSRPDSQPHTPQHTPHPLPHSHPHPLDERRHHEPPEYATQQHTDPHRPLSGPPHPFHHPPYVGPREPPMKRDPSDETLPQHHHRPPSTGNGPEHNVNIHPDEHRRYVMPAVYEPPTGPGPGPYRTSSYPPPPPPPQSPMAPQTPMPNQGYDGLPAYGHAPPTPRDPYSNVPAPYAPNNGNPSKRKPQRAAQACDSCRSLKAKCDEMKPCTSCREKNIPCHFRDPPPKQQDKSQEVLLEAVTTMTGEFRTFRSEQGQEIDQLKRELREIREMMGHRNSGEANGMIKLKEEDLREGDEKMRGHSKPGLHSDHSFHMSPSQNQNPSTPPVNEPMVEGLSEEEDQGEPEPPGPPAMPVNHTTGAARLLLVGPIQDMIRGVRIFKNNARIETFPIVQEERRGLLRLYGRGEGLDLARGYDSDAMTDHAFEQTPSDIHSDASSPAAGEEWGQCGGMTPPADHGVARGEINSNGMPDFRRETVDNLVSVYMKTINIMHPLVTEASKNSLITTFMDSISDTRPKHRQVAALYHHNSTPDSPGSKRKRSRDGTSDYQDPSPATVFRDSIKPGHPFRSINTAMVLNMLALGSICKHKEKIRDVALESSQESSWRSSPQLRNGHPPSPLQGSPTMSVQSPDLPSPQDPERLQPHSRRTSMDGSNTFGIPTSAISGNKPKNLDLIPGLQYFAMATDIIGNQLSGNTLQHVHTNVLASLYHGQLGRVVESWGYLANACRALLRLITPRLARWEKIMAKSPEQRESTPAKDNKYLFAFWTCLQLESDILAELPFRPTGILEYESKIPWPNLQVAEQHDGFDQVVLKSYNAQLFLRKHLNQLHTMFYSPETAQPQPPLAATDIDIMADTLTAWRNGLPPKFRWTDSEPPSPDILVARLRAKYYGARVICYRYFVLKILENSSAKSSNPGETISNGFRAGVTVPDINKDATSSSQMDPNVLKYARICVQALIQSTIAFDRVVDDITKERLIVTNIWGTAHAQWGNVLTLQAVSRNPVLKDLISKEELAVLLRRTIDFLKMIAQPSSALSTDLKLLQYIDQQNGLLSRTSAEFVNTGSFSSSTTGADVVMSGH